MLDQAKETLGGAHGQRVIERGGEVEDDYRCGEKIHADHESGVAVRCRMNDEKRDPRERGNQRNAMADAVRQLFPSRLLALGSAEPFPNAGLSGNPIAIAGSLRPVSFWKADFHRRRIFIMRRRHSCEIFARRPAT